MSRAKPLSRLDFPHHRAMSTRWRDNDVYGHVNNVVYYELFDTAVNQYLIERGVLDLQKGNEVGLVAETGCAYFSPLAFPDTVTAGLRVARLGNTSVRYEIALFRNDEAVASAQGHFVHVYVDRETRRPAPLSDGLRGALAPLLSLESG